MFWEGFNFYTQQVNKNRKQVNFNVGQKMWLNMKNFTLSQGLTLKFMAKFVGPIPITKQAYLMTPTSWLYLSRSKCNLEFQVLLLKSISETQ